VQVWDLKTGTLQREIDDGFFCETLVVASTGAVAIAGELGFRVLAPDLRTTMAARPHTTATDEPVMPFEASHVALSRDGRRLFTAGHTTGTWTIRLDDARGAGKRIRATEVQAVGRDGTTLYCSTGDGVEAWDVETATSLGSVADGDVTAVAVTGDGHRLVLGLFDGTVRFIDLPARAGAPR
jgi:hypothetical protein